MGAVIGRFINHENGIDPVLLIGGIGLSILAVSLAQTFAYQTYAMRLRGLRVRQNSEKTAGQ